MSRRELWERCWSESGEIPGYFSPGEYVKFCLLRHNLYLKYLQGVEEVSEFGCGTGHNLVPLSGMGGRIRGFDWAKSAVDFVRRLGIEAEEFDMFEPRDAVVKGAVITVHAMEQLGIDWNPFLSYLLRQPLQLVIHVEPIEELYDDSPRDQSRLAYHQKRGYLSGYLTKLRELEKEKRIELIEVTKSPFGGKDHDAYSVIVWRPL